MIWTVGASSTGADTGPPGRSPLRGGATLDYPIYSAASLDGDLGDGEKILNIASARPELSGAGFFLPSRPYSVGGYVPILPASFPPLVWPSRGLQAAFLRPCPAGRSMSQNAKPPLRPFAGPPLRFAPLWLSLYSRDPKRPTARSTRPNKA